jgi:uncharacterized protein YdaU (DUF1376 family)
MHFYQFNIADYRKDTGHLTPIEHYIYRELLDYCYLNELPINSCLQSIRRRLKLSINDDLMIQGILDEFFIKTDDGYINNRVNIELSRIYNKSDKARESVKKRWDKVKQYERNTNVYERNTMAILPNNPIPNNPITQSSITKSNRDISANADSAQPQKTNGHRFIKPTLDDITSYCHERNNDVKPTKFLDYYESNGWKVGKNSMKDWKAAIRNWEGDTPKQQEPVRKRIVI